MKILHSADWHLDAPIHGAPQLRRELLKIPQKVAQAAIAHGCDMVLLSGDLFDGPYTRESFLAVRNALEDLDIPVFIAPGNHDFVGPDAPWLRQSWPSNVHIFTKSSPESVVLPQLNCRVYGAAFQTGESNSLLANFQAEGPERYCIGVFHGDPVTPSSPYNPITNHQIENSALDYLALGHIHRSGQLFVGGTLCAWPGCPMGKGYDETGDKGVLVVTLGESCQAEFVPLDTPRFYELEARARGDAVEAVTGALPAAGSSDHIRLTLTGEAEPISDEELQELFPQFPNLQIRNRTLPPTDLWACAGEDTLEGVYFAMLQQAMAGADEITVRRIELAAKISQQILAGQEVELP